MVEPRLTKSIKRKEVVIVYTDCTCYDYVDYRQWLDWNDDSLSSYFDKPDIPPGSGIPRRMRIGAPPTRRYRGFSVKTRSVP